MLAVGGASQRQHPGRAREAKHYLGRSGGNASGKPGDQRMTQHLRVRGKKRKALIGNLALLAEPSYVAVPTEARETPVLHKCRRFGMCGRHLLKMLQRNIAHPEKTRVAAIALINHGLPNLAIRLGPTVAGSGSVEHVAVDVVGPK